MVSHLKIKGKQSDERGPRFVNRLREEMELYVGWSWLSWDGELKFGGRRETQVKIGESIVETLWKDVDVTTKGRSIYDQSKC